MANRFAGIADTYGTPPPGFVDPPGGGEDAKRPVRPNRLLRLRWWVTRRERFIFAHQLCTMLDAGLGPRESLEILAGQGTPAVKRALDRVQLALGAGASISAALALEAPQLAASVEACRLELPRR